MEFKQAEALASGSGEIGGIEIGPIDDAYISTYPNEYWRWILGDIGGMPILKATLLMLLLAEDAEKSVEDWLNENF